MRVLFSLLFIGVIAAAGALVYFLQTGGTNPFSTSIIANVPISTATSTLSTTTPLIDLSASTTQPLQSLGVSASTSTASAIETYSSPRYGFSVQYPLDAQFESPGEGSSTVSISEDNSDVQTEGYFNVNIDSDAPDIAGCSVPGAIYSDAAGESMSLISASTTQINTFLFLRSDRSDGGSANGLERDYTILHNGACYDLQILAFPDSCVNSGCEDRQWSLQTETAMLNQLDSIALSFQFTPSL